MVFSFQQLLFAFFCSPFLHWLCCITNTLDTKLLLLTVQLFSCLFHHSSLWKVQTKILTKSSCLECTINLLYLFSFWLLWLCKSWIGKKLFISLMLICGKLYNIMIGQKFTFKLKWIFLWIKKVFMHIFYLW